MAILAGDDPSESIKMRHSPLASENLTTRWKQPAHLTDCASSIVS